MILWDKNDLMRADSIKIILLRFGNNKPLECLGKASNLKHSNHLSGHSMTRLQLRSGSKKSVINSFQVTVILHTAKIEIYLYICKSIDVSDDYHKDWKNKIITALISSFTRVICSFKRDASWRMLSISRSTLKK